jgi:hypothetical protein
MLLGFLGSWQSGQAADFTCPAGDVACLIAAITTANGNGQANTITLAGGTFDDPQAYTLMAVDNTTDGPNGLPSITSVLVITGQHGEDEPRPTIEREPGAPPFRLLHVAATGNLTLNGLRLEGGLIDANDGGGIFNLGTLTLTTSTLSFNTAGRDSDGGGGLANFGGTVTLTNSSLASNTTYGGGGGLANFGGTVTLTNSSLARNTAYRGGGGIDNSGTLMLINSTLDSNTAYSDGGGIFNNGNFAILTLTDSTLTHNTSSGNGGGISNFASGTQTLTNSTLYDNRAGSNGGGIWTFSGAPQTLTNVTLLHNTSYGNVVAANGGGIAILNGTLTLTNSTLVFNTAYARAAYAREGTDIVNGGGIGNFGGTLMLINSTLAFNTAYGTTGGGGIESSSIFSGSTTLQNTLLALNTAPETLSPSGDCVGAVTSNGNNLIGDPADCTITLQASDLTGDPSLDAFTDDFTPGHGHFPLLATSQAIDAGNDAACPRRDQLGQRRVDIPDVGTGRCDIGAIEFQHRDKHQDNAENDQPKMDPVTAAQATP